MKHHMTLSEIRTFPQLVKYLRDELDWPIESDDFEELTFDYTPEELGIDSKNAAKIQEIRRLRPLSVNQPWGVFFIKFEPKQLPVVALRRILNSVVLKKRASANKSERAAWSADDLLFISNYGQGALRQISFAHFTQDAHGKELPTLKVLGWDNLDTPLHIDSVADALKDRLAWPDDVNDVDGWRETWLSAFTLRHREVITTSKELAIRLAVLARDIRTRIKSVLGIETEDGHVTQLMKAFQTALIHELDEDGFADMYAQTIAYGLLSARVSTPEGHSSAHLPVTNPFLRELMNTFLHVGKPGASGALALDFDELGVTEVVQLLDAANMEAVLNDFGDRNPQEDPVIHFYELFLKEYDAKARMERGVFYTPRPVVSYIIRSIHELLQTEFGLQDGLADTTTWDQLAKRHDTLTIPKGVHPGRAFVTILDPATGTGTFLVEAIDVIHSTLVEKWKSEGLNEKEILNLWNDYVPKHLLPRLHGFELLMAPYAIAHMKIGLKLHETGYRFGSEERARIYLTNSLEPPHDFSGRFEFAIPALAHEADAVNTVKTGQHFTVVVGNPPYSSSVSEPEWMMALLADWKKGLNETKSDLNREEWKFLRFAQHQFEKDGAGVVGFIINRDFLDGIVKRKMREHLAQTFPLRITIDLNGDVKGNIADENVFEIEQGVAISIQSTKAKTPLALFASIIGTREKKYSDLVAKAPIDDELAEASPTPPYFRWVPLLDAGSSENVAEYAQWFPVNDAFVTKSSGIQTKNDPICISYSENEILQRVKLIAELTPAEVRERLNIRDEGAWSVDAAQKDLRTFGVSGDNVRRILYRPFDWRFTYYTHKSGGFLGRPRYEVMKHMSNATNLGLIFNRQIVGDSISQFGVSRDLICHGTFYLGNKGQDYLAPLYLQDSDLLSQPELGRSNFTEAFLSTWRAILGHSGAASSPEEIFNYMYAIFHSPSYRTRYAELLKIDFPRLPIAPNIELVHELAKRGGELVALHLLETPDQEAIIAGYDETSGGWIFQGASGGKPPLGLSFEGPAEPTVGKVAWVDNTVWIDATQPKKGMADDKVQGTVGFKGVPKQVWNFYLGGYQPCLKWLKDRKDRTLTAEDVAHYHRIVVAIHETIRLTEEIDKAIDDFGGWPEAFSLPPTAGD
jgi:hypothetical protein